MKRRKNNGRRVSKITILLLLLLLMYFAINILYSPEKVQNPTIPNINDNLDNKEDPKIIENNNNENKTNNNNVINENKNIVNNNNNNNKLPDVKIVGVPTFNYSPKNITNKDVIVVITYPSDLVVKKYKIGNNEWQDYVTPLAIKTNTTIYAKGYTTDKIESSINSITISNIDKIPPIAPIITENKDNSTEHIKAIDIKYPLDSNLKKYRINEGEWKDYTDSLVLDADCTIYAKCLDTAGNESNTVSYQVIFEPREVLDINPDKPLETLGTYDYITNAGDVAIWEAINIDKTVPNGTTLNVMLATSNDGINYTNFTNSINNIGPSVFLKIRIMTTSANPVIRPIVNGINVLYRFEEQSINQIKPIAVISVSQDIDIKTNTTLTWSSENSYDINQIPIVDEEWEGKQNIYNIPGKYTIRLRVKNELRYME